MTPAGSCPDFAGDPQRSRRLASPGIAALTSSSTLPRRAGRAGTRHWTGHRRPHKQATLARTTLGAGQRRDYTPQETIQRGLKYG